MHKDELLQLHSLLCQMKRFFEEAGMPANGEFSEYIDLSVSPQHIHKSKSDHKRAVFLLGKGISELVMVAQPDHRERLRERFIRLAEAHAEDTSLMPEPETRPSQRESHLPPFALAALSG